MTTSSEKRVDRIERKLDIILDRLGQIDTGIATEAAERKTTAAKVKEIEKDLVPIKKHIARVEGAVKGLTILAIGVGLLKTAIAWGMFQ